MSEAKFAPKRANGKSNQQVVIDLVSGGEPGTVYTYDQLGKALEEGTDRHYDRTAVQQTVRLANERLLREQKRCLRVVPTVGYAIAYARDHRELAQHRDRKAVREMRKGMNRLDHVRLDEMTEQERIIHLSQQSVNAAVYQSIRRLYRHEQQQDRLIASLTSRVEQMEGKK